MRGQAYYAKNGSYNVSGMIPPRETSKLGKRISVISVETAHFDPCCAQNQSCSRKEQRVQTGFHAEWVCGKLRREILLLL